MSSHSETSVPTINLYWLNLRADDVRYYTRRAIDYKYDYAGSDPYSDHDHINVNVSSNIQKIIKSIIEIL